MRKYSISKLIYVFAIMILACLSVGYTYAYFSAIDTASSSAEFGKINVVWANSFPVGSMQYWFDNKDTTDIDESLSIALTNTLKRGEYIQLQATNIKGDSMDIKLAMSNSQGTAGAYCRMKITATYTPVDGSEVLTCDESLLQLALTNPDDETEKVLITSLLQETGYNIGWVKSGEYYYYGKTSNGALVLTELQAREEQDVADYIYLSADAPADMFGASIEVIITLEAVQSANDAVSSVWQI